MGLDWLFFKHFTKAGIPHTVTSRLGGISHPPFDSFNLSYGCGDDPIAVTTNRHILNDYAAWRNRRILFAHQVHGIGLLNIGRTIPENIETISADGFITDNCGVMTGVLVADCYPVLIADREGRVVAVVHAGRRGIEAGIIQKVIRLFVGSCHTRADELLVGIGPGIGTDAYPVDEETAKRFECATRAEGLHCGQIPGHICLDLRSTIEHLLIGSGILRRNIEHLRFCTKTNSHRFYSYRYSGHETGRFAALIGPLQTVNNIQSRYSNDPVYQD
ncbi:peptidoglycan editing factor PgeF [bacterium]|nr:peptidoglycan editing factor PgeF [candidate division CSSED10-310 bacterium]